jgi:Asp-tRNA(Asn)/Glu-tRNA(Gln) amidotransferase A subunit family amidase
MMKGIITMNIVFSSTTEIATAIRAGHVSATEVLDAHLAQIATHNQGFSQRVKRTHVE